MDKKIVLIDGHSILNRAFYGLPDLTTSKGEHTNAILGFLNILYKILDEEKPGYLAVAFDTHHPTFRHEMFTEYKGTRKATPDELRQQVPVMKEVLKAMNVTVIEKPGFEADDVLGTLAKMAEKEGYQVSIVSGDRDLLQLASDNIKIRIPKTKRTGTEIEDYYAKDVIEKYKVTPKQFIDLKGLMGDSSDNIPGIPGVGEKTAGKLIAKYQSIENLYDHIDELSPGKTTTTIKENKELAYLSKELATICTDCDLEFNLEEAVLGDLYNEDVYKWFKNLEFKSLISRFGSMEIDQSLEIEKNFSVIENLSEADLVFANIKPMDNQPIGLYMIIDNNELLGVSLCFSEKKIYLIKKVGMITEDYLTNQVEKLAKNKFSFSVIGLKNQLKYLKVSEDDLVFDPAIAAYLLNPLTDTYHYDDIARDYLGITIPSVEDLLGKMKLKEAMEKMPKEFTAYACYSSYVAYKAAPRLKKQLDETGMLKLFEEIELPLIFTLYDMEVRGIRVNKEALKEYGDHLKVGIDSLEKQIYELVGETFNINSPKQLGVILFEKLKLPFAKKTKTGYSTAADILEKLRSEHPVISMILEYRQLTKLKSTYADGLAVFIQDDGRIHGKFHQTIAATGRISSTDPNLQNIPIRMELGRKIRKVFIPEEGYVFLDADYSQIELRVLAHLSGDEQLIKAYKEAKDIHRITASEVFHTPFDEVTPLQRSNAKAVNFGIIYGISSFGLGQDLNITRKEAERFIEKYFKTFPKIKNYLDRLVAEAKKEGYSTTLFGRRRPIPELASSNYMQRSFGERVAMNSPIQGTAADIIKIAMNRINKRLKDNNMRSRLILQVHDELLVEAHNEEVEEVKKIMVEEMQGAASLDVPLETEVNMGYNWYEAK
ncbi:DNA polymerase I [Herbinix luporum]|jgi:DNA polymerase-1|uniref:DNA polymerase I n=1 Tax=Herbinix luporum TaxID=1679721 RepID=A0A0K8J751_9FIRM|nr:DNA polymerase I [Herbinix luporum]MDI9487736.1 DNA polymerase I [Bacillota bacterium]CUH93178.1 DNA polymerase I [Herbinix luporum]HHT57968.1 DNA polymerase I [Herbinix luporum]